MRGIIKQQIKHVAGAQGWQATQAGIQRVIVRRARGSQRRRDKL